MIINSEKNINPNFSVIMPLYNKESCIVRAIISVLSQSSSDFELIIVDDGSIDKSLEKAKSVSDPRITIIEQTNSGPGAARNRGAAAAKGSLLAFLDSDDEWRPDFLATAQAALAAHPDCLAYACGYDSGAFRELRPNKIAALVDQAGARNVDPAMPGEQLKTWIDALHSSCVVIRKELFDRLGGFFERDRCLYGEDSFLWLQVLMSGPIYWDPAEHVLFHVEDSDLGFAVMARRIARPISLYPNELEQHCPPETRETLRRAVRFFVAIDLDALRHSRAYRAAFRLRRQHGLPAIKALLGDLSRPVRSRIAHILGRDARG